MSMRSSTSVQAKSVSPANVGLVCEPPFHAAMPITFSRPSNESAWAIEMMWPP